MSDAKKPKLYVIERRERRMSGLVRLHLKLTKKEIKDGVASYKDVQPSVAEKFEDGEKFDLSKLNPPKEEGEEKGGE